MCFELIFELYFIHQFKFRVIHRKNVPYVLQCSKTGKMHPIENEMFSPANQGNFASPLRIFDPFCHGGIVANYFQ